MLRRKIQRSVFKSQQLTDSLNLVYELILRDHTKFPTSLDLINHHMYLFNKCAHSNHGHICGNLSHSSKRILCLSDCSRSIHIQFMFQFSLVLVMSDSLRPHAPKHARPPCPSPTPRVYSNSCPLSRWCHLTISSSVTTFSSCLRSFPASVSFPMSQFFASDGQSFGVSASASVFPKNIQEWFPLGWTSWISLQS